ncbi:hypothetical protein PQX77_017195 [Marasmius sp. AFHP31]|nr:hypothetical protein PQX77_017195 [Marasmius sp. AFHP31]
MTASLSLVRALLGLVTVILSHPLVVLGGYVDTKNVKKCRTAAECEKYQRTVAIALAIVIPLAVLLTLFSFGRKRANREHTTVNNSPIHRGSARQRTDRRTEREQLMQSMVRCAPVAWTTRSTPGSANTTRRVERPEPAHTRVPRQATPPPAYTVADPPNTITDPVIIQQTTSAAHPANQATQ